MQKIKQLDNLLIKKIAAGEVIERPASVIKELIENSIDAKATEILVEIEDGGTKSMTIHDNGQGMNHQDALMSYKLHTTSKISTEKDLEQIYTFGFRGEALASISSVSETRIHTKSTDEESAIELTVENAELKSTKHTPRSTGTSIYVHDLFRHLPARKKFLKSPNTEYKYVHTEVIKFALAYPNITFELKHNGREILNLTTANTTKQRFLTIFNTYKDDDLIDFASDNPIAKISGIAIHPAKLTTDRTRQFIFLNKRFVQHKSFAKAVRDGYSSSIPDFRQPAFILHIEINPDQVDVNIHPRKLEAKISHESEIYKYIRQSVEKALSIKYQNDFTQKFESTPNTQTKNYAFNPTLPTKHSVNDQKLNYKPTHRPETVQRSIEFTSQILAQPQVSEPEISSEQPNKAFQVLDTYLIIEHTDKLEIIDQHAADERVRYEKILDKLQTGELIAQQSLLVPYTLALDESALETIEQNTDFLKKLGFEISQLTNTSLQITSIPIMSRELDYKSFFEELITHLNDIDTKNTTIEKLFGPIAASLACHSSIRAGRKLDQIEIQKILADLSKCKMPYSCPHGRPIIWTLPKQQIEKQFERIK